MRQSRHHGHAPKTDDLERKDRRDASASRTSAMWLQEDVYVCPAGQKLAYYFTTEDKGLVLSRYRTNACQSCLIKQ